MNPQRPELEREQGAAAGPERDEGAAPAFDHDQTVPSPLRRARELLSLWRPGQPLPGATFRRRGPAGPDRPRAPEELRLGL